MVQFHDSISKCLHHHTLFSMFFNEIFEVHHAQILSCSNPRVGIWLTTQPIFLTFPLFSSKKFTAFHMWLGLPHPSIARIPGCVCTHFIDLMGIHLLCYVHGNECIGTHDGIHNTFATIAWDINFHVGQK
jgi:hypothetical protein